MVRSEERATSHEPRRAGSCPQGPPRASAAGAGSLCWRQTHGRAGERRRRSSRCPGSQSCRRKSHRRSWCRRQQSRKGRQRTSGEGGSESGGCKGDRQELSIGINPEICRCSPVARFDAPSTRGRIVGVASRNGGGRSASYVRVVTVPCKLTPWSVYELARAYRGGGRS